MNDQAQFSIRQLLILVSICSCVFALSASIDMETTIGVYVFLIMFAPTLSFLLAKVPQNLSTRTRNNIAKGVLVLLMCPLAMIAIVGALNTPQNAFAFLFGSVGLVLFCWLPQWGIYRAWKSGIRSAEVAQAEQRGGPVKSAERPN